MTPEQFQQYSLMKAQWWMHSATNGHAATRHITRGDGHVLTEEELREDAMRTSQQHLDNYWKSCEGVL